MVITTRLHCALPCIAMGIPVVFFGDPNDYRTQIVSDVGGKIYSERLHDKRAVYGLPGRLMQPVDWSPRPIDIEHIKKAQTKSVATRLAQLT